MTFEDFLIAVGHEAPALSDAALRLLLHVVAESIQQATYAITLTDRDVCRRAAIWRSQVGQAKHELGRLLSVETKPRQGTVFRLPASWFPLQQTLFTGISGPTVGPRLAHAEDQLWPNSSASPGPTVGPPGLKDGPVWPNGSASLAQENGHIGPNNGPPGPTGGPRLTENQQDASSPSISISSSEVSSTEREYVISILSKRFLPADKRPEATILGAELQGVLHRLGNVQEAARFPDDVVLAQCLAIAPLRELLPALAAAKARRGRPKSYAWAVSVFLEAIRGIDRAKVKLIRFEMAQMRQAKPPGRAEPLPFPDQLVKQAAGQVKSLR